MPVHIQVHKVDLDCCFVGFPTICCQLYNEFVVSLVRCVDCRFDRELTFVPYLAPRSASGGANLGVGIGDR